MINCPEKASAPGIKPERFVRRSETMEFHHGSETTEFQYEGRGHATSDILDIPLPAIYARISKMGNPASRSVIGICVLHGAVPVFHLCAHHKARQESKAVINDCLPPWCCSTLRQQYKHRRKPHFVSACFIMRTATSIEKSQGHGTWRGRRLLRRTVVAEGPGTSATGIPPLIPDQFFLSLSLTCFSLVSTLTW